MDKGNAETAKGFAGAIALIVSAIALWGFAHRLYATLLPGLGAAFSLTPTQSQLARPAVAIGYLIMALPTAFISRNLGYKIGILLGLGLFAIGMFLVYPAIANHSLGFFIVSASVVGSGLAVLEVTAVPLAVFLGRRESAIQRTILVVAASSFAGLGALYLGPIILAKTASDPAGATSLIALFSTVGAAAIGLAFVMELVPFPAIAAARVGRNERTLQSFLPPLRLKRFRHAMAAGFLCLLAQVIIAGFAPLYSRVVMPSLSPADAHYVLIFAYLALGLGRLIGPLAMRWIAPMRLLVLFAFACVISTLISAVATGPIAVAGLLAACFFTSIIYPTIFADALLNLGDDAKSGAALMMFVAFSGTGLFSLIAVICMPHILSTVMLLPALCYAAVACLTVILKRTQPASGPASDK